MNAADPARYTSDMAHDPLTHLPADSPDRLVVRNHAPYPSIASSTVEQALDLVDIRCNSAVSYACAPSWGHGHRTISDELLFHVVKGKATFWIGKTELQLSAGMCALMLRGVPFRYATDGADPVSAQVIHYSADLLGVMNFTEVIGMPSVLNVAGTSLTPMFQEACREYALRPAGWQGMLDALLRWILLSLVRHHHAQLCPTVLGEARCHGLQRLLPALQRLRCTLSEPDDIAALARRCCLSECQFRRVFHEVVGESPVQYRTRLRIMEARRLLRATDLAQDEIARRVGFSQTSHFNRTFRKSVAMTPGDFRAAAAQNR